MNKVESTVDVAAPAVVPEPPADDLRRRVGLPAAAALVVSGTVGVGIFLTPAGMARSLASPALLFLVWIFMGGAAFCGACTVHLNGVATKSCQLGVAAAQGQNITSIEGLSAEGTHPVQRAWEEHDVPQCGSCQAGQIMAAAALLAQRPKPTEADIDKAMEGNICRCATYPRIRRAILAAAQMPKAATSSGNPKSLFDEEG